MPVYFAAPVRDKNTGLLVAEPGCITLDPVQALAYARARHFQYQDANGRWRDDGSGDLGRITRQQDFIKRALRRASDKGLRNPSTAIGLVDAASKSVVMDDQLSVGTILELVDVFRNFNPDELKTNQIVTYGKPIGGVAYQGIDMDKSIPLLLPFWGYNGGKALPPQSIIVDVSGNRSQAASTATIAGGLDAFGFSADPVEMCEMVGQTTITYGPAGFDAALSLATYLQETPKLVFDEEIVGLELVLGVPLKTSAACARSRSPPTNCPSCSRIPPKQLATTTTTTIAGAGAPEATTSTVVPTSGATGATPPVDGADPSTTDPSTTEASGASGEPGIPSRERTTRTSPGVVPTDPVKAAACR